MDIMMKKNMIFNYKVLTLESCMADIHYHEHLCQWIKGNVQVNVNIELKKMVVYVQHLLLCRPASRKCSKITIENGRKMS